VAPQIFAFIVSYPGSSVRIKVPCAASLVACADLPYCKASKGRILRQLPPPVSLGLHSAGQVAAKNTGDSMASTSGGWPG
jgi:hypothetical protein